MKDYSLQIENLGGDRYFLASKGHHPIDEFKEKALREYPHIADFLKTVDCPCEHLYYKKVPHPEYNGGFWQPVDKSARGSFPVTAWWE